MHTSRAGAGSHPGMDTPRRGAEAPALLLLTVCSLWVARAAATSSLTDFLFRALSEERKPAAENFLIAEAEQSWEQRPPPSHPTHPAPAAPSPGPGPLGEPAPAVSGGSWLVLKKCGSAGCTGQSSGRSKACPSARVGWPHPGQVPQPSVNLKASQLGLRCVPRAMQS